MDEMFSIGADFVQSAVSVFGAAIRDLDERGAAQFVLVAGAFGFALLVSLWALRRAKVPRTPRASKSGALNGKSEKSAPEIADLESELERAYALMETVPDPVWVRDGKGKIVWANKAFVKGVGADSLKKVREKRIELLDEETRNKIAEIRRKSPENENVSDMGANLFHDRLPVTLGGDRRMVDVYETALEEGTVGLAIDRSEAQNMQKKLGRIITGHGRVLNAINTAIAVFDENRRLIFHNRAFRDLWDLEENLLPDKMDNAALFDLLRARDCLVEQPNWSKWRDDALKIYLASEPAEDWWHLPDGRSLHVIASPDEEGGVTWIFEDITEELKLKSRYAALTRVQGETLDHLKEAIAVFGSDGRLKLFNPPFCELWKIKGENSAEDGNLAETPIKIIAEQCAPQIGEPNLWDELATAATGVYDERKPVIGRMNHKEGKIIDYALLPLPDGQNMISFADVTDSVNIETALVERNQALEAAEQLKSDFMEHISAEFRRPLTSIIGFSEMLRRDFVGALNERQSEYMEHIVSSSKMLHSMIDNMLDLAIVDAGILELELEPINMRQAIEKVRDNLAEQLEEQEIALDVHVKPKNLELVADGARIRQALYNLLANAVRFSPKGGTISLACQSEKDWITIGVSDEGPGIPSGERETIFDRFRAKSHSGAARGAGLGLAITESLVKLHGGTIRLDEKTEKGAKFICRFPKNAESENIRNRSEKSG